MKRLISYALVIVMVLTMAPAGLVFAQSEPSDWAYEEVQRAKANGLVTDPLTADYAKNVTREEFCELVVLLYEKITGIGLEPAPEIFEDTANEEILKAYNAGIVRGVSSTMFDPYSPISRQEICVMMTRCIERAIPTSTVYTYNINSFADGGLIDDWAFAAVNYSYDHGVIHGVGEDMIDPLGPVTSEAAILLVNRIYENRDSYVGETVETEGYVEFGASSSGPIEDVEVVCRSPYSLGGIVAADVTEYDKYAASAAGSAGQVINISGKYGMNTIKSADITIGYDGASIGIDEDNIGVARYDEELGRMVLLDDVEVDASDDKVSFEDTALGEYVLVDEEEWYNEWREAQTEVRDEQPQDTMQYYDVVFLVDDSGSMEDNDPDNVRATAVYNFIRSLASSDGFQVTTFTDSTSEKVEYTTVGEIADWAELQKQISNLGSNGGTDISGAIRRGISILDAIERDTQKMIVMLTDGNQDSKTASYDEDAMYEAAERGYVINTVSLGADTDEEVLRSIAETTGGEYYTSDTADELIGIYKEIKGESIGWDGEDTDADTLPDIIETRGMRNQYGIFIKTDSSKYDTDTDTLSDGEEMGEKVVDNANVSVKDIQNGVTAYVYYIMKSDPNFKDSDNDGIPDADDQFPLRADTVSWEEATGVVDRSYDSNNDGISDYYTELIYSGELLTTDGKSFEGYHFGSSADYDGDGLLNGEELVITEADNRIYMQMVSDPTLVNSDGDQYDDYQEVEVYNTDPFAVSLTNSEVNYAAQSELYLAYNFTIDMQNDQAAQLALFTANFVLGSNYDQVAVFKDALTKMFDNIREAEEEARTVDKGVEIIKDVSGSLKKAIRATEATDFENAPDKIKELEDMYQDLLDIETQALQAGDLDKVDELTLELIDVGESISKQENIVNKVEDTPIDIPTTGEKISGALDFIGVLTDAYDFITTMASLQANAEIISENIYILELLEGSDDPILAAAAKELKLTAESELGTILNPLADLVANKTISAGVDAVISAAAKAVGSSVVFWVTLAVTVIDAVFGVSETGAEAIKTMVMAETAEILKGQVLYSFDRDTAIFRSVGEEDLKLYTNLLNARKTGEQLYIAVQTLTPVADFLIGWTTDSETAISMCNDNISKIDDLLDLYSISSVTRRKI